MLEKILQNHTRLLEGAGKRDALSLKVLRFLKFLSENPESQELKNLLNKKYEEWEKALSTEEKS